MAKPEISRHDDTSHNITEEEAEIIPFLGAAGGCCETNHAIDAGGSGDGGASVREKLYSVVGSTSTICEQLSSQHSDAAAAGSSRLSAEQRGLSHHQNIKENKYNNRRYMLQQQRPIESVVHNYTIPSGEFEYLFDNHASPSSEDDEAMAVSSSRSHGGNKYSRKNDTNYNNTREGCIFYNIWRFRIRQFFSWQLAFVLTLFVVVSFWMITVQIAVNHQYVFGKFHVRLLDNFIEKQHELEFPPHSRNFSPMRDTALNKLEFRARVWNEVLPDLGFMMFSDKSIIGEAKCRRSNNNNNRSSTVVNTTNRNVSENVDLSVCLPEDEIKLYEAESLRQNQDLTKIMNDKKSYEETAADRIPRDQLAIDKLTDPDFGGWPSPDMFILLWNILAISLLVLVYDKGHKTVVRFFFLQSILYLVRSFSIAVTLLPPAEAMCDRWVELEPDESFVWQAVLTMVGQRPLTCTDTIYSGHTTVFFLGFLFMWYYADDLVFGSTCATIKKTFCRSPSKKNKINKQKRNEAAAAATTTSIKRASCGGDGRRNSAGVQIVEAAVGHLSRDSDDEDSTSPSIINASCIEEDKNYDAEAATRSTFTAQPHRATPSSASSSAAALHINLHETTNTTSPKKRVVKTINATQSWMLFLVKTAILVPLLNFALISMLYSRMHYTVDIYLGGVVSILGFTLYHVVIASIMQGGRSRTTVPTTPGAGEEVSCTRRLFTASFKDVAYNFLVWLEGGEPDVTLIVVE